VISRCGASEVFDCVQLPDFACLGYWRPAALNAAVAIRIPAERWVRALPSHLPAEQDAALATTPGQPQTFFVHTDRQ
jgi:hypothetical protein